MVLDTFGRMSGFIVWWFWTASDEWCEYHRTTLRYRLMSLSGYRRMSIFNVSSVVCSVWTDEVSSVMCDVGELTKYRLWCVMWVNRRSIVWWVSWVCVRWSYRLLVPFCIVCRCLLGIVCWYLTVSSVQVFWYRLLVPNCFVCLSNLVSSVGT